MRWLLLLGALCLSTCYSLNVLIYSPAFGHHHLKFVGKIADILSQAGHNVTYVVPEMDPTLKDFGVYESEIVAIPGDSETQEIFARGNEKTLKPMWVDKGGIMDAVEFLFNKAYNFSAIYKFQCETTLASKEFAALRHRHFDVALMEAFDFCGLGLFHELNLKKVVLVSSIPTHEYILSNFLGVPYYGSFVPSAYWHGDGEVGSLKYRISNAIGSFVTQSLITSLERAIDVIFTERQADFPGIGELIARSSFFCPNSHPILDYPAPTIGKVIPIGGLVVDKPKEIGEEWHKMLKIRKKTFLVSFGTVLKAILMPDHYKRGLLDAMAGLPNVTFIWKYEGNDLIDVPENVILVKWMPQSDLLAHVDGFLTHAGIGSTMEASHRGCPVVTVPIFIDQHRNARMLERHGTAVYFDKLHLGNAEEIRKAMHTILYDPSYRSKARTLAKALLSYHNPAERIVQLVEFTGRYGPFPLTDSPYRSMSWLAREGFDFPVLLPVVFLVLGGFFYGIWTVLAAIQRRMFPKYRIDKEKKRR